MDKNYLLLNEVRLGNIIDFDGDPWYVITEQDLINMAHNALEYKYFAVRLNDIALIGLGFKWKPNIHRWVHKKSNFHLCQDGIGYQSGYGNGDFIGPYIESVHHLQNLHFFFTGKELKRVEK